MDRGRSAAIVSALVPSIALGQAVANGSTGTPLIWMWVGIAVVLLAIVIVLLFADPVRRVRARGRDRAQRGAKDGA